MARFDMLEVPLLDQLSQCVLLKRVHGCSQTAFSEHSEKALSVGDLFLADFLEHPEALTHL